MKKNRVTSRNMLYSLLWVLFLSYLVSCSESKRKNNTTPTITAKQDTIKRKPPSSFSDTIIIDYPAAVFYNQDSLQLEKIKAITDTMIFDSNMHDCFYQMKFSRNELQQKWPSIKIVEIQNVRFILFKLKGGNNVCIDLNSQNDPCGIFLFDGYKKPRLADMPNIDSELGFYFSK